MKTQPYALGLLAGTLLPTGTTRAASAIALGTNGHWATCHFSNQPLAMVERKAIENCRRHGGTKPVIRSTWLDAQGYRS